MSTTTAENTAQALTNAQDALDHARTAHQAATQALAALDQQAAAGEDVDPAEYASASTAVTIRSRRLSRAQAEHQAAADAHQFAQRAARVQELRDKARNLPTPDKARDAALKAVQKYLEAVDTTRKAYEDLHAEFRAEFGVVNHNLTEGVDGIPANVAHPGTPIESRSALDAILADGERHTRRTVTDAAERITDDVKAILRGMEAGK